MKMIAEKSQTKALQMELCEYKGRKYLQVMELWRNDATEEWKFSKKNVSINALVLDDFLEFVETNKEELKKAIVPVEEDE